MFPTLKKHNGINTKKGKYSMKLSESDYPMPQGHTAHVLDEIFLRGDCQDQGLFNCSSRPNSGGIKEI